MKRLLIGLCAVIAVSVVLAQEYKSRQPRPEESRRVAGLNFYPQDSYPVWLVYSATNYQPFALLLGQTNNVVFTSLAITNVYAIVPDCSNSVGATFNLVSGFRTTVIITNANEQTFDTPSNATAAAILTMRTNSSVTLFSTGTNWYVLTPDAP